jgi:hypothetical protein
MTGRDDVDLIRRQAGTDTTTGERPAADAGRREPAPAPRPLSTRWLASPPRR